MNKENLTLFTEEGMHADIFGENSLLVVYKQIYISNSVFQFDWHKIKKNIRQVPALFFEKYIRSLWFLSRISSCQVHALNFLRPCLLPYKAASLCISGLILITYKVLSVICPQTSLWCHNDELTQHFKNIMKNKLRLQYNIEQFVLSALQSFKNSNVH